MGEPGAASVVTHPHTSAFHGNDAELIEMVAPYVAEGLDHGERVVVVITDPHRAALDEALHERGIDSTRARRSGAYLPWGAEETLRTFLVDGSLDRERFNGTIGGLLGPAPAERRRCAPSAGWPPCCGSAARSPPPSSWRTCGTTSCGPGRCPCSAPTPPGRWGTPGSVTWDVCARCTAR